MRFRAVVGIAAVAGLVTTVCVIGAKSHRERSAAELEKAQHVRAREVLRHAGKFAAGMSEDDLVRLVGAGNWSHFEVSDGGAPKSVFTLDRSKFLVIEWRFQDVPANTANRRMYSDAKRHNQRIVRVLDKFRVGDSPE